MQSKFYKYLRSKLSQSSRNKLAPFYREYKILRPYVGSALGRASRRPDFLIIGAQKAGTTSAYDYMIQHPDVVHGLNKEISFFDRHWDRGERWYFSHFSPAIGLPNSQIGEATPDYLFSYDSPIRIAQLQMQSKFIVLLRDPVDRAVSHYFHEKRLGREVRNIEQVFLAERDVEPLQRAVLPFSLENHFLSYAERGFYHAQLTHWFKYFGRERFLVLKSEDFFDNPVEVMQQVFSFLDLKEFRELNIEKQNVGTYDGRVSSDILDRLRDIYSVESHLLKQDFSFNFD